LLLPNDARICLNASSSIPTIAKRGRIMRLIFKLLLAIVLCGPVFATTSPETLRDMVIAGDIAAVEAALEDAAIKDATSGLDPETQRDLFKVFWVTHPAIDAFTDKWMHQSPTSAAAMTARAWYLHAMGYANRGQDTARYTYQGGVEAMQSLHQQAFSLFVEATKADPGLLAASDGILVLAQTVADDEVIPVELERIMALHPNRGSLMRAMYPLAPQWGGRPTQVYLLCDRYAPQITSIKNYTPEVCATDAVFYANFAPGRMRTAAYEQLSQLQNPILDYARQIAALDRFGPATQRLAVFEKLKAQRPLTPEEVIEWRIAFNEVNGLIAEGLDPAYAEAVSQGIDQLRLAADRDPLNTAVVTDYINRLEKNLWENSKDYDEDDAIRRLQTLLVAVPHSWRAWNRLAKLKSDYSTGNLEATDPYFQNAIYYSNYGLAALQDAIDGKTTLIDFRSRLKMTPGKSSPSPEDTAELDQIGVCPLVALVRITDAVCASESMDRKTCLRNASWWLLNPLLEQTKARNACQQEENAPLESLLKGPVAVDF
jgi:hypothetical protein